MLSRAASMVEEYAASKYYSLDKKQPNNQIAMRAAEKSRWSMPAFAFHLYVQVHRFKIMKRL